MRTLSLIFNKKIFQKKNIYYYGHISELEKKNFLKINPKINFYKNEIIKKKERKKRFIFCEKIFNRILPELSASLNNLHNVKYSKERWKIILSKWLKVFIYLSFLNYTEIKKILKKKKIKKTIIRKSKNYLFVTNDHRDLNCSGLDESWNENLNSKIFEFFFKDKKNYLYIDSKIKKTIKKSSMPQVKIPFVKKIVLYFFNLFHNKNPGVIFRTYLNFINELKLSSLIKNSHILNKNTIFNYDDQIDFKIRNQIKFKKKKELKTFENFLYEILPITLPKIVIENFSKITKISENLGLPEQPRFIFTGIGHADQVFNFYLAKQIENKKPYIVLQHGNGYFSNISNNFTSEHMYPNYIFSWGAKEKKNHIPIFNIKTLGRKKNYDPNGDLLVVCNNQFTITDPENYNYIKEKNMINTIKTFNQLNREIKLKTYFKLFPNTFDYRNLNNYFKKLIKEKFNLYNERENYFGALKKSRLVVFNYDSTGFYENLSLNIPTILFSKEINLMLNDKYIKYYRLLKDVNILIDNEKNLISHISKNWEKLEKWWFSKTVQNKISLFNSRLNKKPKNLNFISKNINLIIKNN